MTSTPSPRPVSALRARMIEDMMVRGFAEETRTDYVRHVRAFAAFIRRPPDTATAEDLRRFQLHQTQTGMQPPIWSAGHGEPDPLHRRMPQAADQHGEECRGPAVAPVIPRLHGQG